MNDKNVNNTSFCAVNSSSQMKSESALKGSFINVESEMHGPMLSVSVIWCYIEAL